MTAIHNYPDRWQLPMARDPRRTMDMRGIGLLPRESPLDLMFRIVGNTDTSIVFRAGVCCTHVHGVEADIELDISGGTSGDPRDTVEVSGLTVSTWIVAQLDDPLDPTQLTLVATGSTAFPADNTALNLPVAYVEITDSKISGYYQAHTGPWLRFYLQPDGTSLEYHDTDLDLEINGWQDVAATSPLAGTEEFMYRPTGGGAPGWGTAYDLVDSFSDWSGITIDGATLANVDCIWNHDELLDIVAGTAGDNHNAIDDDEGNYPYVSPRGDATRIGNRFLASTCLADAAGEDSIRPNERQCFDTDGATIIFDWAAHQLYFDDGGLAIDWDTTDVVSIPNTVIFKVLDITDTNGSTTGAIIVDGGGLFKKNIASLVQIEINAGAKVHIAENDCLFTVDTDFDVHATDDIILHATGDLDLEFAVLNINGAEWETCLVGDLTDSDLVLRKKP